LVEQIYREIGPSLGTHSECRTIACIVAGVTAAWQLPARVEFIPDYVDPDGQRTPHFQVVFEDDSRLRRGPPH
jgi:hypothetical protein